MKRMDNQMKKMKIFEDEFILNVVTISNVSEPAINYNFKFLLNETGEK